MHNKWNAITLWNWEGVALWWCSRSEKWPDFVPCVDVFESRTINSHTLWICRGSSYRSHILSLIHLAGYHTSANGLPVEVSGFPNNVSSPPPWRSFLILRFVRWAVASCAASCLFCAYCCCLGLRTCKIVPQTQDTVPFLVCLAHEKALSGCITLSSFFNNVIDGAHRVFM